LGVKNSDRERDIFDFLADRLDKIARETYGVDQRRPALRLQLEQARRRLKAFASRQAELFREGWRIAYAENDEEDRLAADFPVDDSSIELVGRIDRIDFNESTKTVRILDYKTADSAVEPNKAHRKSDAWVDLQLPLYRHLWRQAVKKIPAKCGIELGYFNLPKKEEKTEFALAEWDDATLAEADEKAREVIRLIRKNEFWPPQYPAPDYSDDLAAICLDNVRSRPRLVDDQGGDE
jgi:ATP-dependent helicase/DNAse subunit B